MQEGLLEKITAMGYWRVNIRPLQLIDPLLSLQECSEKVTKASVSLRGWDYPHIQRNNEHGGTANVGTYVENWCDWYVHSEFWRMYRSGQFLHYKALWEDMPHDDQRPQGTLLSVVGAVYTITEIVEFLKRLYHGGLYKEGVLLSITLGNSAGRHLWINDVNRLPFLDAKRTEAQELLITRELTVDELEQDPKLIALAILLELFDHFGWAPEPSLIQNDQESLYKRP